MNIRNTSSNWQLLAYIAVYIAALIVLLPMVYILFESFRDVSGGGHFLFTLTLDNFQRAIESGLLVTGFVNSIIVTVIALIIAVLAASLAGYVIARRTESIFLVAYLVFLSSLMIPTAVNLVSLYALMKSLGLINTRTGLILLYAAGAVPFGVLLYVGFMRSIPRELDEAAIIDGCGLFRRYWSVILPLLKPAMITHAVLASLSIWNDFLTPSLLISDNTRKPFTLALYAFTNVRGADYSAIYAALVLAVLPPIIFFLAMQRYFYTGIIAGAVKG